MGRLIDADEMIKRLHEWNTQDDMDKALYSFALHRIIEQSTAYDVDAVVRQLEKKMAKAREKEPENTSKYFEGEADVFEIAIKIVKGGGAN